MKIYLDSIGCRLNISELEHIARLMQVAGWEISPSAEDADLILINTCTVTAKAGADSRQKIRHASRVSDAPIVVTGCWSTLAPQEAAKLPGVTAVVPNADKDSLVEQLLHKASPDPARVHEWLTHHSSQRLRTRSFIKVQDGCNNRCAYCITTIARGVSHSLPIDDIVAEIRAAELEGSQEIVLSGVHLGMWGADLPGNQNLATLLKHLLHQTSVPRVHLSSLEPWGLPEGLFDLWSDPRLVKHLHMPLQSGSDVILRRMGRHVNVQAFTALAENIRNQIPNLALTTDLIAGFPGETEEDHHTTMNMIKAMRFAGGHVFPYSERPGTRAAEMENPVHHADRKARAAELRAVLESSSSLFRKGFLGTIQPVLWIKARESSLEGISLNDIKIYAEGPADWVNHIQPVRLDAIHGPGVRGTPLPAPG